MGYKNLKYVPYKVSCVSFVPRAQYNVDQLQVVVSSRSDRKDAQNSILVLNINSESISKSTELKVESRTTDIGWLNEDSLIVGNKKGQTVLYHHKDELNEIYTWSSETKAISSVSVFEHFFNDSQYVRTSEDGSISVLSTTSTDPLRSYRDECTVNCSLALSSGHVLSGNQFGQAKLWDLRTNDSEASKTLKLTSSYSSLLTVAQHPGRTHLILGGCSDGHLSLWDLRQGKEPVSFIARHQGPIWTLKFHPLSPVAVSGGADSKIYAQSGNWEEEISEISTVKDLSQDTGFIDSVNSVSLNGDYLAAGGDDCCLLVASLR